MIFQVRRLRLWCVKRRTTSKTKNLLHISSLRFRAFWSRTVSTLPAMYSTRLEMRASCFVFNDVLTSQYFVGLTFFLGHLRSVNSHRKIRALRVLLAITPFYVRLTGDSALKCLHLALFSTADLHRNYAVDKGLQHYISIRKYYERRFLFFAKLVAISCYGNRLLLHRLL